MQLTIVSFLFRSLSLCPLHLLFSLPPSFHFSEGSRLLEAVARGFHQLVRAMLGCGLRKATFKVNSSKTSDHEAHLIQLIFEIAEKSFT